MPENQDKLTSTQKNANTEISAVVEELVPPRYPESWECCGSDCGESCVYTIYAREKEEYDRQVKLMQSFFDGDKNHESD